ncbi:hypothetical protein WDZ92_21970 [Nostoc sp. NIES-2111]
MGDGGVTKGDSNLGAFGGAEAAAAAFENAEEFAGFLVLRRGGEDIALDLDPFVQSGEGLALAAGKELLVEDAGDGAGAEAGAGEVAFRAGELGGNFLGAGFGESSLFFGFGVGLFGEFVLGFGFGAGDDGGAAFGFGHSQSLAADDEGGGDAAEDDSRGA